MGSLTQKLAEIRERLANATPGPWKRDPVNTPHMQVIAKGNEVISYHGHHPRMIEVNVVPNHELIANAPQDLALLLAICEMQATALNRAATDIGNAAASNVKFRIQALARIDNAEAEIAKLLEGK